MIKDKKTEVEMVEELLRKEGFTKLTAKDKESPEFKKSLAEIAKLKRQSRRKMVLKKGVSKSKIKTL